MNDENKEYCNFGNGEKCEIWGFYNGDCGEEYNNDNFSCVKEGNIVFGFEKCCEGLEPNIRCGVFGQPSCREIPNILVRIWESIACFFHGVSNSFDIS